MGITLRLISNQAGASPWIEVASLRDGIASLWFAYLTITDPDMDVDGSVFDINGDDNGWAILKTTDGYVFMFVCQRAVAGFTRANGSFYAYKIGHDPELLDWPNAEFFKIPRHCFLKKEDFEPLLLSLYKSENPEEGAAFVYSQEQWECVSDIESREP